MNRILIEDRTVESRGKVYLRHISLKIDEGETWVFLGANGSGKTRLGELLLGESGGNCGLVSFEREKIVMDRERIEDMSDLLDRPDPGRSAAQFILEKVDDRAHMEEMASRFHFSDLLDRGLKYLSTGELRKVLIAEELMSRPDILILDEPYDGLDAGSREDLSRLIESLIEGGINLILLLNRFSEIPARTTHGGYLQEGRLLTVGPIDEFLKSEELNRLLHLQTGAPTELPPPPFKDDKLYSGDELVRMKNIRVAYGEKVVLDRFDWTLEKGEHWKITGPNGVGKSTLLSLITGDNPQAYGNDLTLFGMKKGSGETVWDIKKHIGYVSSTLHRDYRVRINVLTTVISGFHDSIGVYEHFSETEERTAREWLKLVGMDGKAKTPFQKLSFGEQRLILVVRAMVKHPPLLILDEPCHGLDEINRLLVLTLIELIASRSNTTVLYVTHHEEDRIESVKKHLKMG